MADTLEIRPVAGALGAEVRGLSADRLDEAIAQQLMDALATHLVLILPGLEPTVEQFRDIGALFGELEVHPYIPKVDEAIPEVVELDSEVSPKADLWHTDVSFSESPPIAALLHMVDGPEFGGDTMWINTLDVYDTLSAPLKAMLDGLTCTHNDARGALSAEHPVVRVQPGTGRKSLFVNKQFSRRIPQLSRPESQMLLAHLFRWQEQVRLSCRWRWSTGDVVIWDERFTLHSVVDDTKERRLLHRATVLGDGPPLGVPDAPTWPDYERNKMASSGYFGIGGYEF
jgi:taurine dioxygenase